MEPPRTATGRQTRSCERIWPVVRSHASSSCPARKGILRRRVAASARTGYFAPPWCRLSRDRRINSADPGFPSRGASVISSPRTDRI
jgi:hypothetical protein